MIPERKAFTAVILFILFITCAAIVIYPFWPPIRNVIFEEFGRNTSDSFSPIVSEIKENLLIIPKIGVRILIVEGVDESALEKGAWHMPQTSTPDKGSNTVVAGHRWKYRPPSEETFYLLDKLEIGDTFQIHWQGHEYDYKVASVSIVLPTELDVLSPTKNSIATLLTCHPLFSTERRLIVIGKLIE